jgi:hypothetical protein
LPAETANDKTAPESEYPWMEEDPAGIWNAPSGARVAWFKDPDGNTFLLTEF